jgi:hypothetical protein
MPRTLRVLIQVLCLSLLARAGLAQDAEGCKDHPLVSRMPGFNIARCTLNDFGSHAFKAVIANPSAPITIAPTTPSVMLSHWPA